MRLTTRVAAGFGVVLALAAAGHLYQLSLLQGLQEVDRRQTEWGVRSALAGVRIYGLAADLEEFTRKFLITGDDTYRQAIADRSAAVEAELAATDRILAEPAAAPLERSAVELRQALATLRIAWSSLDEAVEALVAAPPPSPELPETAVTRFEAFFDAVAATVAAADGFLLESFERSEADRDRVRQTSRWVLAVTLAVALLVPVLVYRSVSASLARLRDATRRIAEGDFTTTVAARGRDELAELGTHLNRMARRLGELDQLKKDFVSGVSHDLRAPLASIQETTRLLLEELGPDLVPMHRELLELNLQAGRRLSRMIGDLLDLSRFEAGVVRFEFAAHPCSALVREALDGLGAVLREKGLRVEIRAPEVDPVVRADRLRIIQVLQNLLTNAAEFSPPGEAITLTVEVVTPPRPPFARGAPAAPECRIAVEDRGPGVPAAYRERIFERFFSADPEGVRTRKGTGLGLALCRYIVEAHGGRIWVEDRPSGPGGRFCFTLPLAMH
ncbi:MAG: hypothetical protein Kow00109_27560 [Acidobacteriota bacterium]